MTIFLKQSTASQEVLLGPFLDDTDGKTAETALSIANTDIKVWKAGGTTEASKNSGGATHIASGRYYAVLDATDTDTVGPLVLNVHVAGALPVRLVCTVLSAKVFDSLIGATDNLEVDVIQWLGTAVSTPTVAGVPNVNCKTWNDLATVALPLAPTTAGRTLDVAATGEAGLDFNNVLSSALVTLHSLTVTGATTLTGIVTATNASNSIAGCGVTAMAANVITAAAIADAAIDAATFAADVDAEIAAMIWNAATASYGTAGSYGELLEAVKTDTDDIQTRLPAALVSGRMDSSVGAMAANVLTASALATDAVDEIVDQVWNEVHGGHLTAGTTGESLSIASTKSTAAYDQAVIITTYLTAYVQPDLDDIQTRLPAALVGGRMDSSVGAMAANVMTASALAADAVAEIWTTALTESYGTDGSALTGAQILYLVLGNVGEFSISSVTKTVKRLDGTTTAATYTLDSATTPTSITRAT